jgi:predicted Rossmann fold nucleotide-binding protein DprA/Smf involved in DNA uptake
MPYKSTKILIAGTTKDRRIKLTLDDKELIVLIREREQLSYQKIANKFGVSKRLIIFVCNPEKMEQNKKKRDERGGSIIYYDRVKHTKTIKEHRQYKQKLFVAGEIKLPTKENNI